MSVKFYKVGGAVRDQILGLKSKDLDFAVECSSYEEMRQAIIDRDGKIFLEQPQYLTIRAKLGDDVAADYVMARRDGTYTHDGRRPDFVEPGTILDDLKRRDFTVNAIAIDEEGNYLDPHNGKEDIKDKIIRCVGDPKDRFREDSLRMLRAIRFSITKGFRIEEATMRPLFDIDYIDLLNNISVERIAEELKRCFEHDTLATMDFLDQNEYLKRKLFSRFKNGQIWLMPVIEYNK